MLAIGTRAPEFATTDGEGQSVDLVGLLEDGPFVLYFYPADFTPGCTMQACMIRDLYPELTRAGIRVFGVSRQSAYSHESFREKYRLPFRLLCDTEGALAAKYDARGLMGMTKRVSYYVDADGHIADREESTLRIKRHEAFIERVLGRARQ